MTAVVCIDEGILRDKKKDYNGRLRSLLWPEPVFLFPAKSEEERIKIVAGLFIEIGIKNVASHEGCGAVGLGYQRDFPGSGITKEELEEYGKSWVKKKLRKKTNGV